jgi:hypothetical protein
MYPLITNDRTLSPELQRQVLALLGVSEDAFCAPR